MIIRNGYNVYPREVEEVLYAHPDVLEAVVVGVPDARLGEEVVALVGRGRARRCDPAAVQAVGARARRRVQVPPARRARRRAADGADREDPQARDRPRGARPPPGRLVLHAVGVGGPSLGPYGAASSQRATGAPRAAPRVPRAGASP